MSLGALKSKLVEEKAAREKAQAEAETLSRVVDDLKKKVKHLDNKVLDGLTELHAKELGLERTTKANEDYKSQNERLIKKLESKLPSTLPSGS
jgi:chromosome segregation ATPase